MGNSASETLSNGALTLVEKEMPYTAFGFWEMFWNLPQSQQQINTFFTPDFVRTLKDKNPGNFSMLLEKVTWKLSEIVYGKSSDSAFRCALNCLRILMRVLPIAIEDNCTEESFEYKYMWNVLAGADQKSEADAKKSPSENGNKSDDAKKPEDGKVDAPKSTPAQTVEAAAKAKKNEKSNADLWSSSYPSRVPLAQRLVVLLTNSLFLSNFTCAPNVKKAENGIYLSKLWAAGVGVNTNVPVSTYDPYYDQNRCDVLRCLIICLSAPIYSSQGTRTPGASRWITCFSSNTNRLASTLFYSTINVVCSYSPSHFLPYSYSLSTDFREGLVDLSLQFILVMTQYVPVFQLDLAMPEEKGGFKEIKREIANFQYPNLFRNMLCGLDGDDDLERIYNSLTGLLQSYVDANNTRLPFSAKQIGCYQEVVILLWKFVEENPAFWRYLTDRADLLALIRPLFFLMYEGRSDPSKIGLVYMCIFILLKLSSHRALGTTLNKAYPNDLPFDSTLAKFNGTYADLFVVVSMKLIVSSQKHYDLILRALLILLGNISPYITKLSDVSCVKLLNMFKMFSAPSFLYANQTNNQYVSQLLEIFNNILLYQAHGNSQLIYSIVRRSKQLYTLTVIPKEFQSRRKHSKSFSMRKRPTLPPVEQVVAVSLNVGEDGAVKLDIVPLPAGSATSAATAPHLVDVKIGVEEDGSVQLVILPAEDDDAGEEKSDVKDFLDEKHTTQQGSPSQIAPVPRSSSWTPTYEWIQTWRKKLPVHIIYQVLDFFIPQIDRVCKQSTQYDEKKIMEMINTTTLVGIIPPAPPVEMKKYTVAKNDPWFSSYLWSIIFLRNQHAPLFDASHIKLFHIASSS